MGRKYYIVILFVFVALLATNIKPAFAQSGACPPNSTSLGDGIGGNYPASLELCSNDLFQVFVADDNNGWYPCSQQTVVNWTYFNTASAWNDPVYIVPDSNTYYGDTIRLRMLVVSRDTSLISPGDALPNSTILRISYYTQNNLLYSHIDTTLNTYPIVYTYYTAIFNNYYPVYVIDQELPTNEPFGGYIQVRLYLSGQGDGALEDVRPDIAYASIQVGGDNDIFPAYCPLPNGDLPATPQPGPTPTGTIPATWTPNATPGITATPTPVTTPAATATGISPAATWTPTPIIFSTIPAENTPTPWPPYQIPTVAWPTPFPTVYSMMSTREASGDSLKDLIDEVRNDWATPQAEIRGYSDPNNTIAISATNQINDFMTRYVYLPIGYLRGISDTAPNAWRYILWLFYLVVFVIFVRYTHVVIRVSLFLFELIRRAWEAIPFN